MECLKSIKIKGKDYVMVNERLMAFREDHPDYALISEILHIDDIKCVIKAIIKDEADRTIATGLACEFKESSMINKTSYVENAETSAWGRALGNLGYGIITSIASAEEVVNAILSEKNEVIGGDFVMPVGKHSGKKLSEINNEYLMWFIENGKNAEVVENIEKYFADKDKQQEE